MEIANSKTKQNLVVFMELSEDAYETPLKGGNMILNRFCIDEDAAFELSGVNYLKEDRQLFDTEKGKEYSENCIHSYSKLNFHEHLVILQKEHFVEKVITAALQKISENEAKELKIHFVYAGCVTFTPTAPRIGQMVFSPFGQLVFDQSSVAVGLITLFSRSRNRPRLSLRRLQFNER